jgi:hypothetical protein
MSEEEQTWKFYSASIDSLNEKIFQVEKDYANTLDVIFKDKQKVDVLEEFLTVKEGEYYVDIQQATDDVGKPLYKNEELRKIELKNRMRVIGQYQEVQKIKSELPMLQAKLEFVKQQLNILIQEKEYRIRVIK